ncbi:MAG: DMT family transporter [Verrucomicrobiaceae bacterium]|nr:MAG: DMT family transporter [Verrucomicrobiaceae bacterium]
MAQPPYQGCGRLPRFIYLQLHLLVALLATTAVFGHLITLGAPALVVWRSLLAALGGAFLLAVVMRREVLPPPGRMLQLIGIGGIVGMHWMCFFGAIKLANISICLAGLATVSFFTAFTEPLLERRRVRPLEVLLGLLVLLGILLVAGFERGRLLGLAVALLSALLAAVFPVLNRRLIKQAGMNPLVMVVWEMVGACAVCLLALPLVEGRGAYAGLLDLQGLDWLWLLLLAWACTVFAHAFHIHLLRHLSAYTANLAVNFEPVYGIVAAALLFGEHRQMHPGFFIGTSAILIANIAHPLILREIARRKSPG